MSADATTSAAAREAESSRCDNCGASFTGRFCSECGQRAEPPLHSLWHFAQEATENLTHADSRVWRTLLPLLFRPGYLTHRFLDGARVRYLPPFRLYLAVSVLFFALVSALGIEPQIKGSPDRQLELRYCENVYTGPGAAQVAPRMSAGCAKAQSDGGKQLFKQFLASFPGALLISLPVLALVMKGLYRRQRRFYIEHLLFLVHLHSFLFVFVALLVVVSRLIGSGAAAIVVYAGLAYMAWYLFRAMQRVYAERLRRTLPKFVVLVLAYGVCANVLLVLTLLYSIATL